MVVTKIVSVSSWTSPFRLDIASYSAFVLPAYVAVFRRLFHCSRTMPPIRGRRPRVHKTNAVADLASLSGYSVQQLRNLCKQKKITSTGNKTTLLTRLRGSGLQTALSTNSARAVQGEQTSNRLPSSKFARQHAGTFPRPRGQQCQR